MMNEISVDDLVRAIDRYSEARNAHDKALAEFDGYSWDYHGAYYIDELNKARDEFRNSLNGYVDQRIAEALKKRDE